MNARSVVDRHWPYDGPHTDDTVADAALAIQRLCRYLANATYRPLSSGPALYRTLSRLNEASVSLEQALQQMASGAVTVLGDDETLYDDRRDRSGIDTVLAVASAVDDACQGMARRLELAAQLACHLGHDASLEDGVA